MAHSTPHRSVLAVGLVVVLAVIGCSSDDDSAPEGTTVTTSGVVSDLIELGEQVCTDEPDDVSISAVSATPPPIPVPSADILSVTSTLDEEQFTTSFELAGEPDPRADYVISVGLPNDFDGGFEIQLQADAAGVWAAELAIRTEGAATPTGLPDAQVTLTDTTLDLVVPRAAIRPIGRDQPLLYGTSVLVRDGDTMLSDTGEPTSNPEVAARALDDCITFGQ